MLRSLACLHSLRESIGVDCVDFRPTQQRVNVRGRLADVALDVHRETRCLRDREPEVDRDRGRYASEADDESPDLVERAQHIGGRTVKEGLSIASDDDERKECGGYRSGQR